MAGQKKRGGHPARKPVVQLPPAGLSDWIAAARIRTLPLAVAPVVAGTGAAWLVAGKFHWLLALACLAVAVFLQIGVNYANDYSDGIRGADDVRVGPARLTGAGRAKPRIVLLVALSFFALAALAGLAIVVRTGHWWLLLVGVACIAAAWFYTGGKRPYGYAGFGELFVFAFFGLVATVGSCWVQAGQVPQEAWFSAVGIGLLACGVLLANNLRDIDQDRLAGKRTLTVRIGALATKILFTLLLVAAYAIAAYLAVFYPGAWLVGLTLLAALPAVVIVWFSREPRELVPAVALTSLVALGYGFLLAVAFVV